VHPEFAQVVGGHVGDRGGVGAAHGEAAAQHAAARRLEDRELDPPVAQQRARAARAGVVAARHLLARHFDPVGRGRAGGDPGRPRHGGEQADRGGLAVGAGDQDDRHVVNALPGDLLRPGQLGDRPGERAGAQDTCSPSARKATPRVAAASPSARRAGLRSAATAARRRSTVAARSGSGAPVPPDTAARAASQAVSFASVAA